MSQAPREFAAWVLRKRLGGIPSRSHPGLQPPFRKRFGLVHVRNARRPRGVSGTVKPLPIVILATLVTAFGVACGDAIENSSQDSATGQDVITQPPTGSTETMVYFLIDDGAAPIGVRRTIKTESPYAREALNALLSGPTPEEMSLGITTAIPEGVRLLTMTYKRQGADARHRWLPLTSRCPVGFSPLDE
jgi:hypothetical protein